MDRFDPAVPQSGEIARDLARHGFEVVDVRDRTDRPARN